MAKPELYWDLEPSAIIMGRRWYSGVALGYTSLGSRVQIPVIH